VRERVTLENWQCPPHLRWAYQHVRELVPTARITRGDGPPRTLEKRPVDLLGVEFSSNGAANTVGRMLAATSTDGFLVLHRGAIVTELYENGMSPTGVHLLQSVSKSVAGSVAGILAGRGELDPEEQVVHYLPELAGGSFEGATLRHLLDMRTGTRFSEVYDDPGSDIRLYEPVIGWCQPTGPLVAPDTWAYIATLENERGHGGIFEYRSILTDLLGWLLERVGGVPYADLVSRELWSRIGAEQDAEITVDRHGCALADGGMSASLRDLGRFGQMILEGGRVDGEQIVPAEWIEDTRRGGDDASQSAFARSDEGAKRPRWSYRNKWWVLDPDRGTIAALGIHGQTIYVDPETELVGVKLSTWPVADEDPLWDLELDAFAAIGRELAG
jgi:CubicO group peptidase (beta-lactamase class C family)